MSTLEPTIIISSTSFNNSLSAKTSECWFWEKWALMFVSSSCFLMCSHKCDNFKQLLIWSALVFSRNTGSISWKSFVVTIVAMSKGAFMAVVSNRFWAMPHFGISKILMTPVIFNSYIFKILLQFIWRKLKRPLTGSLNKPHQNITMHSMLGSNYGIATQSGDTHTSTCTQIIDSQYVMNF